MPIIPVLARLRQDGCLESEASLGYISKFKASLHCTVRPYLQKTKRKDFPT